jgi:rRNA-processing protein FCF1
MTWKVDMISNSTEIALGTHVVILDTCFAMQPSFEGFLANYGPTLRKNRLIVPYKVRQELDRLVALQDHRLAAAQKTIQLLETALLNRTAEYRRDPEDDLVINDNVIVRVVKTLLEKRDVLVLTHDRELCEALFKLHNDVVASRSNEPCVEKAIAGANSGVNVAANPSRQVGRLIVAGVNKMGCVFDWERPARNNQRRGNTHRSSFTASCTSGQRMDGNGWNGGGTVASSPLAGSRRIDGNGRNGSGVRLRDSEGPHPISDRNPGNGNRADYPGRRRDFARPFTNATSLAANLGQLIPTTAPVAENSTLFRKDGSPVTLRRSVASGGEGTIFELDDTTKLCKIYRPEKLTVDRQLKIELMLSRTVADKTICWPEYAVYDGIGTFRGFVMPRASGSALPLGHTILKPYPFLKNNPTWTRRHTAQLSLSILEKIQYLHSINVRIGDINPQNILMQDENNVFFVDCDSYQVEGYPCPVGTVNFTAPEIQGSDFRTFLRTDQHELFSVATLLFMLFMPGKTPYSHQGGGDGAANIKQMHFPYALGERNSCGAPEGPWRFCWSHLSKWIKEEFDLCFNAEHRYKPRTTIQNWNRAIKRYHECLTDPDSVFVGPACRVGYDLSILPQNQRRVIKDGQIMPPLPTDGMTDSARAMYRLAYGNTRRPYPAYVRHTAAVSTAPNIQVVQAVPTVPAVTTASACATQIAAPSPAVQTQASQSLKTVPPTVLTTRVSFDDWSIVPYGLLICLFLLCLAAVVFVPAILGYLFVFGLIAFVWFWIVFMA